MLSGVYWLMCVARCLLFVFDCRSLFDVCRALAVVRCSTSMFLVECGLFLCAARCWRLAVGCSLLFIVVRFVVVVRWSPLLCVLLCGV